MDKDILRGTHDDEPTVEEAAGLVRRCARGEGGGGMVEEAMFKTNDQKADDRFWTSQVCGRVSDRPGKVPWLMTHPMAS